MNTRTFNLPPLLMKIGKRHDLLKLKEEGEVYFGTYRGYRDQERTEFLRIKEKILKKQLITADDFDLVRRDSLEGLEKTLNGVLNIKLMREGKKVEIKGIDANLNLFQQEFTHLYCMFGFASKIPTGFRFDERLSQFGDHILLFNSKIFLTALADNLKSEFDFNYVSYYQDDIKQPGFGPFAKRALYSYQYEYRIATNLTSNKVNIGDALARSEDTLLMTFKDLNKLELHIT